MTTPPPSDDADAAARNPPARAEGGSSSPGPHEAAAPATPPADADRTRRRLALLLDAPAALAAAAGSAEEVLRTLAGLVVPVLADWSVADLLDDHGTVRRVTVVHPDPARADLAGRLLVLPFDDSAGIAALRALVTGHSELLAPPDVLEALLARGVASERLEIARRLGVGSLLVVPLRSGERVVGSVTLLFGDSGRAHELDDVRLAEELARRAGLLLDRARLVDERDRAIRARDEFLSVVSHDLRNPLGVVLMNVALLERSQPPAGDERDDRTRRQLLGIRRSVEQMSALIRDLVEAARIESGGLTVDPAPVSAGHLVAEAHALLESLTAARGLAVTRRDGSEGARVLADRDRVLQALGHIVGRAAAVTPPGGAVAIEADRLDGLVRFAVRDGGPPIPEAELPRLFERPGSQARKTGRGAAVGLFIARAIVDAHGGAIWVEPVEGGGTAFYFTLPATA